MRCAGAACGAVCVSDLRPGLQYDYAMVNRPCGLHSVPIATDGGRETITANPNFSRGNLGWLSNGDTLTVTTAGDYTVTPIEIDDPSGPEVLRIPRADTGTYITLEFRQPFGTSFDTFSAIDPVVNGVTVRLTAGYSAPSQMRLVDTTPSTSSFADAPLSVGQTLVDPMSGVAITSTHWHRPELSDLRARPELGPQVVVSSTAIIAPSSGPGRTRRCCTDPGLRPNQGSGPSSPHRH